MIIRLGQAMKTRKDGEENLRFSYIKGHILGTCAFFSRIGRKKEQHLRAGKNVSFRRYEYFCTAINFRGRKNELPGTFF